MMHSTKVRYTGTTPGADANTYTLFDSTQLGMGKGALYNLPGAERLLLRLRNPQAGTLKGYRSDDGGVTWEQVYPDTAVAAMTTTSNDYDLLIAGYRDFKLDWTNGGSAQTGWDVDMALLPSQVPVT